MNEELAVALVEGTPVTEFPKDLHIPPEALKVFIELFEGPLDLLLYLVRRQNINVLEIEVAEITKQYIDYINLMEALEIDLAGEYLAMAAMLTEIKSRMLLPRISKDEEEEDPKEELIRRLQEYEEIKLAAGALEKLPRLERDVHLLSVENPEINQDVPQPHIELKEVLLAFSAVLKRAEMFTQHRVEYEALSVRDRMASILTKVNVNSDYVSFYDLFEVDDGRLGIIVSFLALMELSREGLVEFVQREAYSEIHIKAVKADIENKRHQ
jgi:segregation and condensation protein A